MPVTGWPKTTETYFFTFLDAGMFQIKAAADPFLGGALFLPSRRLSSHCVLDGQRKRMGERACTQRSVSLQGHQSHDEGSMLVIHLNITASQRPIP